MSLKMTVFTTHFILFESFITIIVIIFNPTINQKERISLILLHLYASSINLYVELFRSTTYRYLNPHLLGLTNHHQIFVGFM
jgi:hypothetical protein